MICGTKKNINEDKKCFQCRSPRNETSHSLNYA